MRDVAKFPTPQPDLVAVVAELTAKVDALTGTVKKLADRGRYMPRLDSTGACLGCLHHVHAAGRCSDTDRFGRCECDTNWTARFTMTPGAAAQVLVRRRNR